MFSLICFCSVLLFWSCQNWLFILQVTNNVVTSDKGVKSPSLGRTWSHVPHVRVLIGHLNDDVEQSVRTAVVVKNSRGVRLMGDMYVFLFCFYTAYVYKYMNCDLVCCLKVKPNTL